MLTNLDGIITGKLSALHSLSGKISGIGEVKGTITIGGAHDWPEYDGPCEVTPTDEVQELNTAEKVLLSNIIINPIPSNYGLITWNGAVLTVS